jgi:Arc/MetJ family transcription regulator
MRTNIDIDDKLMRQAMAATGTTTKKAAVEACLRKLIALKVHEKKVKEVFRLQEIDRKKAEREGRLDEWHAELVKKGNCRSIQPMRTNIEIDDKLMSRAMALSGKSTKKSGVEEALRLAVQLKLQEGLKKIFGMGGWEGNLDEMRESRFPDWICNAMKNRRL